MIIRASCGHLVEVSANVPVLIAHCGACLGIDDEDDTPQRVIADAERLRRLRQMDAVRANIAGASK